jgi:PAS domain S-box-containing protein
VRTVSAAHLARARETQQALQATLPVLLDTAPDCILVVNHDGRIVLANARIENMFGYPQEELLGHPIEVLLPDQFRKAHARHRVSYFSTPYTRPMGTDLDLIGRRKDGSEFPVDITLSPLKTEQGLLVISVVRDITERKRTEEALRESEEKYRTIIQNIEDGYYEVDIAGNFTFFNDSLCRILGYPPGKLMGVNNRQYADAETSKQVYQAFNKVFRTEQPRQEFDWPIIRKDGTKRYIDTSIHLIRDAAGKPIGFRGIVRDITERKQAEEALRLSEERFSKAFNASPVIVTVSSLAEGRFLNVNDSFLRTTGFRRKEVIGRTSLELNLWPEPGDRAKLYQVVQEHGSAHNLELNFRMKSGEMRLLRYSAETITVAQEPCLLVVAEDITERKRAEEALRESEERFRSMFEATAIGVAVADMNGRLVESNRRLQELLGYSGEELHRMVFTEFTHPDDATADMELFKELIAGKRDHYQMEKRYIRKDGRVVRGRLTVSLMRSAGNEPQFAIAMVEDITERKRAEEALRQSEAEYRSLIQGAAYGIYRSTAEGKFLDVNPALVAMLGYDSEAELLAANLATEIYRDPGERARVVAQYLERWDGLEVEWKRKDGAPITVRLSGRAVRDAQGKLAYFEGIAENVTEQRLLEAQLRQAQKMEAVGRLAGGVAHDFNNLLMVMRGYTELLLGRLGANDPLRRNAEEIQKAADRATSLTQQLLAFSRKQVMQPKIFDLNAVVSDTEKMLRRLIGEDIELATLLGAELGRVKADPGQIEQVILNLAVNARDAMPQGGQLVMETANVELTQAFARQHPGVTPGPHVMLAMSDTGVGMDAETQALIFEPFFTTKEKGKGTGLGLATVYGIVKQSGGYIWVYSEAGQGTTFEIYLPRVEDAVTADQEEHAVSQPPSGSETVLLVEDEEPVRKLAREFLENSGYTVLEAEGPARALQLSDQHRGPIHLMVTDVIMPHMSGHELAQQMASVRPEMKVLYISGYTDDALGQYGVPTQDSFFLQKPFSLDTLARKMRTLLEGNTKTSKKETLI